MIPFPCPHCAKPLRVRDELADKKGKCPACGKKKYQKQLSAAGFQLKGSGWYATDFKGGKTENKT